MIKNKTYNSIMTQIDKVDWNEFLAGAETFFSFCIPTAALIILGFVIQGH